MPRKKSLPSVPKARLARAVVIQRIEKLVRQLAEFNRATEEFEIKSGDGSLIINIRPTQPWPKPPRKPKKKVKA